MIKTSHAIIFSLLLLSCLATQTNATSKTYVLSYSPGTLFHQLVRDRVKLVYEKAGFEVRFVELPHHRSLLSADHGTVDGDVGRVPSIEKKYPNLRRVDVKLMDLNGAVYTNRPELKVYDEDILKSYRVGYVLGVRWAENKLKDLDATPARDYETLFKMLSEDRVDVVLATEASADAVLSEFDNGKKILKLEPFVFSAPIYHYVNKKNSSIIPLLEKATAELNQAGVLIIYSGVQTPLFDILESRLQEACRRIGKTCEVRTVGSSERALALANGQGDGDALRLGNIKELAPDLTHNLRQIPEPILNVNFHVYTNRQLIGLNGWDSLKELQNGFRVGVKILEKNVPGERIILPDSERLFKMLGENRLDTVIEHSYIADYVIAKLGLKHIHKHKDPLVSRPGYFMIHQKHKALVPKITASLTAMKADGTFAQLQTDVIARLLQKQDQ